MSTSPLQSILNGLSVEQRQWLRARIRPAQRRTKESGPLPDEVFYAPQWALIKELEAGPTPDSDIPEWLWELYANRPGVT